MTIKSNKAKAAAAESVQKNEGQVTIVGAAKYDSMGNVFTFDPLARSDGKGITSNAMEFEDEFKGLYGLGKVLSGTVIIEPSYNFAQLEALADRNNALRPCIDAIITNVDGTGWVIERADKVGAPKPVRKKSAPPELTGQAGDPATQSKTSPSPPNDAPSPMLSPMQYNPSMIPPPVSGKVKKGSSGVEATITDEAPGGNEADGEPDDPKVIELTDFFKEPWPGMSFTTMRRKLRRDLERTGNAYMEVIRDQEGNIVFIRHVESKTMRLIQLDPGFYAEVKVMRGGKEVTLMTHVRRRRFVQRINQTNVYFKEFGAEKMLHRRQGKWIDDDKVKEVDPIDIASEIIHLIVDKDVNTPYGVPRWISQIPSILGSRQAEEYNLNYFGAGGVPPALIMVEGGILAEKAKEALETFMSADPKAKNRAVVIEVAGGAGGSIADTQKVGIKVEKFGDVQSKDSMFEKYDEKCELRIRKAWRLPPLFVGMAQDYSYASAYASYVVAEAQVFKPERDEFDEVITLKLVRALTNSNDYVFRSLGLSVSDVQIQVNAVMDAQKNGAISKESYLEALNELLSLDLEYDEAADLLKQQTDLHALQAQKIATAQGVDNHALDAQHKTADLKTKELQQQQLDAQTKQIGKAPPGPARTRAAKDEGPHPWSHNFVMALAEDMAEMLLKGDLGVAYRRAIADVGELNADELALFKQEFAKRTVGAALLDRSSTEELSLEAARVLGKTPEPENV